MRKLASAKIYFCFAVLFLVAKPFLGFGLFSRLHPPTEDSIFVKAFTKRKQEYTEDSIYDIIAIQKKLADPVKQLLLHFSILLRFLFPALFNARINVSNSFLRVLHLRLAPIRHTYLLNGKLII